MNSFKEYLLEAAMETISALEFRRRIKEDPGWFATLEEPLSVNLSLLVESDITHLSPYLTFPRRIMFAYCHDLDVLEGNFLQGVTVNSCGLIKIGQATIKGRASFADCKELKVAEGKYNLGVSFRHCGITEIKDLHITGPDERGIAADFTGCSIQKISNFTYKGKIDADDKTLKLIAEYDAERIIGKVEGGLNEIF
jgi:hypothetical protein